MKLNFHDLFSFNNSETKTALMGVMMVFLNGTFPSPTKISSRILVCVPSPILIPIPPIVCWLARNRLLKPHEVVLMLVDVFALLIGGEFIFADENTRDKKLWIVVNSPILLRHQGKIHYLNIYEAQTS